MNYSDMPINKPAPLEKRNIALEKCRNAQQKNRLVIDS